MFSSVGLAMVEHEHVITSSINGVFLDFGGDFIVGGVACFFFSFFLCFCFCFCLCLCLCSFLINLWLYWSELTGCSCSDGLYREAGVPVMSIESSSWLVWAGEHHLPWSQRMNRGTIGGCQS